MRRVAGAAAITAVAALIAAAGVGAAALVATAAPLSADGAALPAACADEAGNLLTATCGFDQVVGPHAVSGWTVLRYADAAGHRNGYTDTTFVAGRGRSGSGALEFAAVRTAGTTYQGWVSHSVHVTPGERYRLGLWVRNAGVLSGAVSMVVGGRTYFADVADTPHPDWVHESAVVTATSDELVLDLFGGATRYAPDGSVRTDPVYVDDVSVIPVGVPQPGAPTTAPTTAPAVPSPSPSTQTTPEPATVTSPDPQPTSQPATSDAP